MEAAGGKYQGRVWEFRAAYNGRPLQVWARGECVHIDVLLVRGWKGFSPRSVLSDRGVLRLRSAFASLRSGWQSE